MRSRTSGQRRQRLPVGAPDTPDHVGQAEAARGRCLVPEAAAMAREDTRLTLRAVARLQRRSREVLALRYYLDLTDLEIAQALGVSRGTVSSTASRALAALHRELKEEL
jgi:RNA polymerase sigma factor (sigma-70 family)